MNNQNQKTSIVLVHGAFADGSSWNKVIPILEAEGFAVTAVQNPLKSLADDVATTKIRMEARSLPKLPRAIRKSKRWCMLPPSLRTPERRWEA